MLRSSLIFLFSFLLNYSFAQEATMELEGNPAAANYSRLQAKTLKASMADTINLPFIDDFSDREVVPKISLWSDRSAYINKNYGLSPVSAGVATLDALDQNGSIYSNAGIAPFQADHLTSQSLNLAYPASDSIYLSFFYQAGGLGEIPETGDSLLLDFYSVNEGRWKNVWSVRGDTLYSRFTRAMIPITDPSWLRRGFRFRFRNYASLLVNSQFADQRGNTDHWNIDYVRLDRNRRKNDTVMRDVTFTEPMLSILKDYESVPWKHFEAAHATQMRPYIRTIIANHDSITRNMRTSLVIRNITTGHRILTTPTSNDILSKDTVHYLFSYDYPFNFSASDSGLFGIKAILGTDFFDLKQNDTLLYRQVFADYYSLDDGSAEAGYGLRGDGTNNSSVAMKFNTFVKDTLRAVDIYFNRTFESLNLNYYFYLNVWSDDAGKPGTLLVSQEGMRPAYSDSLNKFVRYRLNVPLEISGTFYIGWRKTVDKFENAGFDRNRINNQRLFFTSNGVWRNSIFPGTLMIRPVISRQDLPTSSNPPTLPELMKRKFAYPNPADDVIFINTGSNTSGRITAILYDLNGRHIRTLDEGENSLYTGDIEEGIYILRINSPIGISSEKIIISH